MDDLIVCDVCHSGGLYCWTWPTHSLGIMSEPARMTCLLPFVLALAKRLGKLPKQVIGIMEALFKILANSVVLVHIGFVAFVVFGGLLVFKRRWVMWVHIPAAAWGALIEFIGWPCPLTPLENMLRRRAGEAGYEGGFIERYMMPILYPIGLSRETQFVLGCVVLVVNLLVYGWLYQRWRRACLSHPLRTEGRL